MLRIYKHYDFELLGPGNVILGPHVLNFPSYPGVISSTDDYYIINQKMVVMETTLEILNEDVYDQVLPADEYIPDFFRLLIANRLATGAKNWVHWLGFINSGTYNSQWMIVDLEKFEKSIGKPVLMKETFVVAE